MPILKVKEGKDYPFYLIYKDTNGFVIDITGSTARMMMRRHMFKAVGLTKAAIIDGPNGKITLDFVPADTLGLLGTGKTKEEFVFDVELTLANGKKVILMEGEIHLSMPVTRD